MNNQNVRITQTKILSDDWYTLKKITFDYKNKKDQWISQSREAYDRGNGATVLLFNKPKRTIILTRQFRMPTYVNGNESGMMIETCAGLLDEADPAECMKREIEEETGYVVPRVELIFEAYMSPGAVTEKIFFFTAEYDESMKKHAGGGIESENEEIEVMEVTFDEALQIMARGEIVDGKTIMLLLYAQAKNLI